MKTMETRFEIIDTLAICIVSLTKLEDAIRLGITTL